MLALTIRNVVANKARFALVTLAVVIGVSFVSSTFVFSDSLSKTFAEIATQISSGADLEVRPVDDFGSSGAMTNSTATTVAELDGVRAIGPSRESENVIPLTDAGDVASGVGVGLSWIADPELSLFSIVEGRAPQMGEFALSAVAAERDNFVVGNTYTLSTPSGTTQRDLVGLARFDGGEIMEANVTFSLVPLADAQVMFGGAADRIDSLRVSIDDTASADAVRAAAEVALSDKIEVVSQRTIEQEQQADFNSQIALLRNLLLGFAVVSLFVSTFIIKNTFGIILSQRVREIGLLRAIGAEQSHIRRTVFGEALLVGIVASVLGLLSGVALNAGLIALFDQLGASFPDMETVISTRTIVLAAAIGIGVTTLSAMGPARQAGQVSPVTAMRGAEHQDEDLRRRVIAGAALTFVGILVACFGLFTASGTQLILGAVGAGIVMIFLGVTVLSPALTGPVIGTIGAPIARLAGVSGELAEDNARRNRRRTANTAAALMIGLALITTTLVVGQSVKQHVASTLDDAVSADFVVANDFDPMTNEVENAIRQVDELGAVLAVSEFDVKVGDDIRGAEAASLDAMAELFDVGISVGALPEQSSASALLSEPVADELAVTVGDPLEVFFDNGASATFAVAALFTDTTLLESGLILDRATVQTALPLDTVDWVAAGTGDGIRSADAEAALLAATEAYPQAIVQTRAEYRESVEQQVDQLLSIVNVMLALSIVIALIGIGLTLALSVFERTREIGLLRAIGMSTSQVRRMIRWEAALIATFGAVLGVLTGLGYGWGMVSALPDAIASSTAVPVQRIALLVAASAIAGLLAAVLPARRAARMNVLDAITGRPS